MSIPGPGAPGMWQPPAAAQPTTAVQFADLGKRVVAYIIDAIILTVVNWIVLFFVLAFGIASGNFAVLFLGLIIFLAIALAISAAYFVYTWTTWRASPGQRVLQLQVAQEGSGATLTRDQAIRRWIYLSAPQIVSMAFTFMPFGFLGSLVSLAALVYWIALLYTTYQSPTKQGLHDQWAKTVVVQPVVAGFPPQYPPAQ